MRMVDPQLDPELETLLEFRSAVRRIPDDVRGRVLARSRAFLSGKPAVFPVSLTAGVTSPPASASSRRALGRLAIAASIALVAGAAGALAALHTWPSEGPSAAPPSRAVTLSAPAREDTSPEPRPALAPTARQGGAPIIRRHPAPGDPLAEVELLQRAQLAHVRRDFSGALALVAEHARRFPRGPLAEECEALRVEALIGSGRVEEARRMGAAFAVRFPRSVLLRRIEAESHDPK